MNIERQPEPSPHRLAPLQVVGWLFVASVVVEAILMIGGNRDVANGITGSLIALVFARTCFRWSGRVGEWWQAPVLLKYGFVLRFLALLVAAALLGVLIGELVS